jgi:hypothetical protein
MLTQSYLLGGWLAFLHWSKTPEQNTFVAGIAGFSFGMAVLTRYDSIMVWMILLPVLGGALGIPRYRTGVGCFLFGALPCVLLWSFHQKVAPYYSPLGSMVGFLVWGSIGCSVIIASIFCCLPPVSLWARWRKLILGIATLGWWLVIGVLWRIRPWISSQGETAEWFRVQIGPEITDTLFGPAKVSMLYMESNFHSLGLILILLLVPVLWWKANTPARIAFALTGAGIWLVLAWNPLNDLFMMWVSRRFVPVVIPWIVVGTVVGLATVQSWIKEQGGQRSSWIPLGVVALMILLPLPQTWFQIKTRDWPGAIQWFERTASVIPDDAVVVTDQPGFGSPLRFIWGKKAFELRRQKPELVRQFLDLHEQEGFAENLFFMTSSDLIASVPGWVAVEKLPMRSSIQSHHRYKIPTSTKSRGGDFVLYHWVGHSEE